MRKLFVGHIGTASADYRRLDIEPIRVSERVIAFNWLKFADIQHSCGKIIGRVGLDDFGLEAARCVRAFDTEVLYTERNPVPAEQTQTAYVSDAPLNVLLERSDVVSRTRRTRRIPRV